MLGEIPAPVVAARVVRFVNCADSFRSIAPVSEALDLIARSQNEKGEIDYSESLFGIEVTIGKAQFVIGECAFFISRGGWGWGGGSN